MLVEKNISRKYSENDKRRFCKNPHDWRNKKNIKLKNRNYENKY